MSERGPTAVSAERSDAKVWYALAAVLVVGFVVRAQVSLLRAHLPGEDGAYYLVQVRGVLRDGRLPIPDFPLLFYTQAGIAWLLSAFVDQRAAIVAAVRWTDATVPVLLAVPAYQFVRDFAREAGASRAGAVLAVIFTGIAATVSHNALFNASGAIKNGCALPFSLFFLFHLYRALRDGGRRSLSCAALFLLVSSLTHVSALALNGTITVFVVAAAMFEAPLRARALRLAVALAAILAAVVGAALLFDADRAARVLGVLLHPARFVTGVPDAGLSTLGFSVRIERVVTLPFVWFSAALGALGFYTLWRYRAEAAPTTRVILWASTLTTLFFSLPVLDPDLLERLSAVAFVPGLVPLAYLMCRNVAASVAVLPLTGFAIAAGALTVKTLLVTGLAGPAHDELARFRAAVPPGRNIVLARHGLGWWAAWMLDTHFSNYAASARTRRGDYDAVLLLEEIEQGAFGRVLTRVAPGTPGVALRDGALLAGAGFTTLAEGRYFRLSRVEARP